MVYRPVQPPLQGQYWDTYDYSIPSRLKKFYGERRRKAHHALVETVSEMVPLGRWLDIGCGPGDLLAEASAFGWDAFGVDPSSLAIAIAERKGLKVLCGLFPEDVPKTSYDVISIIYTLEYIEHPKLMLMECNRRLKPMGVLALQLKNFSYWAHGELLYRSKIGIWCPADIRSYTRTTIIRLLEMCRLKPLKITPSQITGHPIASSCLSLWTKMSGHIVSPSITVISRPAQEAGLVTRKNG